MNMLYRLSICGAMALGLAATPAAADTIHASCSYTQNNGCLDNGVITPEFATNSPTFGMGPASDKGSFTNLLLTVLIPNNVSGANSESFSITGANTQNGTVNSQLYSSTAWTSSTGKDLVGYLASYNITANPTDQLSGWLPSTQTYQSSATGYYVYTFSFGAVSYGTKDPSFSSTFAYPAGTVIAGFGEDTTTTCKKGKCTTTTTWTSTPNSAALLVAHVPVVSVPEPDSLALLGGAFIGVAGLWLLRRRAGSAA